MNNTESSDQELYDLEANKRDHKVEITDVAISKVPLIRYKEIAPEHYETIQELAKMVLETAREYNECNEVVFAYSLDGVDLYGENGEYLAVAFGDEHSVAPESNADIFHLLRSSQDCIIVFVHNHPSLSKISLQDISYLLRYECLKMIVAVTNRGSINYIVKGQKYDRDVALEMFETSSTAYVETEDLKEKQRITNDYLNHCHECGFIFEDH